MKKIHFVQYRHYTFVFNTELVYHFGDSRIIFHHFSPHTYSQITKLSIILVIFCYTNISSVINKLSIIILMTNWR